MESVISQEFGSPLWALWTIPVGAIAMVLGTIAYTRIVGLRTFSKMSSFDFAITVATGSIIGGTILSTSSGYSVGNGLLAIGAMLAVQATIAVGRRRFTPVSAAADNTPRLLMVGTRMVEENLREARVTEGDVYAKLREANVLRMEEVRAVVLETTGDISVLHGDDEIDLEVMTGVAELDLLEGKQAERR